MRCFLQGYLAHKKTQPPDVNLKQAAKNAEGQAKLEAHNSKERIKMYAPQTRNP